MMKRCPDCDKIYTSLLNLCPRCFPEEPIIFEKPLINEKLERRRMRGVQRSRYREHPCHICGLPIPQDHPNKLLLLSVDHILPVSSGGETEYDNLAAAHLLCNLMRGTKDITVKLREKIRFKVSILLQ